MTTPTTTLTKTQSSDELFSALTALRALKKDIENHKDEIELLKQAEHFEPAYRKWVKPVITSTLSRSLNDRLTRIIQGDEHRLSYRQTAQSLLRDLYRAENVYSDLVNTVRSKLKLLERGVL